MAATLEVSQTQLIQDVINRFNVEKTSRTLAFTLLLAQGRRKVGSRGGCSVLRGGGESHGDRQPDETGYLKQHCSDRGAVLDWPQRDLLEGGLQNTCVSEGHG